MHEKTVGSRAEVWHGTAHHTSGGLKKKDLMKRHGRIVSKAKSMKMRKGGHWKKLLGDKRAAPFGGKTRKHNKTRK